MSTEVPDYYRSLIENTDDPPDSSPAADGPADRDTTVSKEAKTTSKVYRADAFQLTLPSDGWCDHSTYTLRGPRLDGVSHDVMITVANAVDRADVRDFAAEQVDRLLVEFDDSRLLMDDPIRLHTGLPAYRAMLSWTPTSGRRLYQEQIYVLHEGRGFTLTASFTRASRKELGEEVEQLMLGFHPVQEEAYGRIEST